MRAGLLVLALSIALAVAGLAAVQKAADHQAQTLIARVLPYAGLGYQRLWAWPWGSATAWNLSLQPSALTRTLLGLPEDSRLFVREAWLRGVDTGPDGELRALRLSLYGLSAPPRRGPVRGLGPARAFSAAELGLRQLRGEAHLQLQPSGADQPPMLTLQLRLEALGEADLQLRLEADESVLRGRWDRAVLHEASLRWLDQGLAPALRAALARRAGIPESTWQQRLRSPQGWPDGLLGPALALAPGQSLGLRLAPLRPLPLDELRLYAPAQRADRLGLGTDAPPARPWPAPRPLPGWALP
ncbi:MAG TPA: hypothetical protein VFV27_03485 [Nevskiaceae bacterium]|nr:hypothetical protein [Nevskiaceae bacterium]